MTPNQWDTMPSEPSSKAGAYEVYQVYSPSKQRIFETLREAAKFARSYSKSNPGLSVLLSTHYRRYSESFNCMCTGGITIGFYRDGFRLRN